VITSTLIGFGITLVVAWLAFAVFMFTLRSSGQTLAEALRVVPDALRLAFTLYRDQTLPRAAHWRLRIARIYNIQPINLVPDFVPVVGFADNVAALSWAIRGTVRAAGEDAVARHWRGSPEPLATLYRALRLPAGSTGIPDARLVNCER
jgi:uncharacterized membrane protein YkvA (DUF1232 family)